MAQEGAQQKYSNERESHRRRMGRVGSRSGSEEEEFAVGGARTRPRGLEVSLRRRCTLCVLSVRCWKP